MPRVSIITPTHNRHAFLTMLWNCIKAQSIKDWEWLIHDSTEQLWDTPDDPRIRYKHNSSYHTIGLKRNILCDWATGKIIAHMDDDDYYAPHYLEIMLALLGDDRDFAKLTGFYVLHCLTDTLGYVDLDRPFPLHYQFDPDPTVAVVPTRLQPAQPTDRWGYGFSYVYTKRVWEKVKFPDQNFAEDIGFAKPVLAQFRPTSEQDWTAMCLHRIHGGNTSRAFPQQVLPHGWLNRLFPHLPVQGQ